MEKFYTQHSQIVIFALRKLSLGIFVFFYKNVHKQEIYEPDNGAARAL